MKNSIGVEPQKLDRILFLLLSAFLFIVFFRPIQALKLDVYNPDSACYADWLYRFFGAGFWNCKYNYYYPGTAFVWFPMACIGSVVAWILGMPSHIWIEPLVGFTTFGVFLASIWINIRSYRLMGGAKLSIPILIALASPVLPYASIHTFLAHSVEFFFTSLLLNALLRRNLNEVVLWAILTIATRPTGILSFAFVVGFLLDDYLKKRSQALVLEKRHRFVLLLCFLAFCLVAFRTLWKGYGNTQVEGEYSAFWAIVKEIHFGQLWRFLVGDRNGMLFTGAWWLALSAGAALLVGRLSWAARGCLLWMAILGLLCIGWGGNGSQDGWFILYRYLTSTYVAAVFLYREIELKLSTKFLSLYRSLLWIQASVVAYLTFVNNFGIPKIWDIFLSGAPLGATLWKHLTLIAYMPVPVAIFSWLPKLSEQFYGGKHFIQGPGLWLLTIALILVFVFIGKTVRRLSLLRYQ